MQTRFLASEVGSGLRRNLSMAISVVLVTMVSIFLLGLGLLAQRQADTMKGYWYDRIQISIYLCLAILASLIWRILGLCRNNDCSVI